MPITEDKEVITIGSKKVAFWFITFVNLGKKKQPKA